MTATVHLFSDLVQRKEIQRLEAAVRANNIPRIGAAEIVRNDLYFARSRDEQRFKDVPLEKTPVREPWIKVIGATLGWVAFLAVCVIGLPLVFG